MALNTLIWVGLGCCLAALTIQVFPEAAIRMGAEVGASWMVFGFGVFLILMSAFIGTTSKKCDH